MDNIEDKSNAGSVKFGRWQVFAFMAVGVVITIGYISNVISVDNLLKENLKLRKEYSSLFNTNKMLKSELNKLQSAEWVNRIAVDSLGMVKSTALPQVIK